MKFELNPATRRPATQSQAAPSSSILKPAARLRWPWLQVVTIVLLCASSPSQAENVYWKGTTDANWTTAANWTGSVVSNTVVYDSQATGNFTQTLGQNWAINGITVANPGGGITINAGSTLTNSGNIDMSAATVSMTNKAPMVLSASQTWAVGGPLTLTNTGAVNLGSNSLTINTVDSTSVVGNPNNTFSGTGKLIKMGNGTLYMGGGSYTGGTFINGGTNFMIADHVGAQWSPATMQGSSSAWVFNGKQAFTGTLTLSNATMGINRNGNFNSSNVVSYGASTINVSEMRIGASSSGSGSYTNIFDVVDGTLTLNINRLYGQTSTSTGSVMKVGAGMLVISNLGTSASQVWNGATLLNNGIFQVYYLANSTVPNNLGVSSSAATNLIFNGGTLQYVRGAAASIDRLFSLGTNGGTLDASAAGALSFTNRGLMGFVDIGPRTLTLTGTNLGGNTLAASIGDNGGPTTLVKTGPGCWVLGGTNTYTGGTVLSNGTLLLGGICTMTDNAQFGISGGSAFGITNTLSDNLTDRIGDNATIALSDGTFNFLNDGSPADFSETVGPLVINSGSNTVVVSAPGSGHTSSLTFKSLTVSGGGTVNFQVNNVAATKIFFTQAPPLGAAVTVNGYAAKYDAVNGLLPNIIIGLSQTGVFTGGDLGEGLDLQGTDILAEYYADDASSYTIQNAVFTSNPSRVNATGAFGNWGGNAANFGDTLSDQNLGIIGDHWYEADVTANANLAFSVPTELGKNYNLQLIFHDGANINRPMKVTISSQVVASSLNLSTLGAGASSPKGIVISYAFTGTGGDLPIKIESLLPGNTGAILNALTLETYSATPQQPYVVSPMANQAALAGSAVQFTARISGIQLSYVWQKQAGDNWVDLVNGAGVSGATSAFLTLANVSLSDSANYRVIATNSAGSATSSPALLNVIPTSPHAMVGHWISGAQSLSDTAGFAPAGTHDGYLVGATDTFSWSSDLPAGFTGYSIDLTAGDVGVAIANTSTADAGYYPTFDGVVANSLSIAFWAKGWPSDWNPFVSKRGENDLGYQIRKNGSFLYPSFTIRGTVGGDDTISADLVGAKSDVWHHYAGTWDGATGIRRLYVDNVLAMVQYGDAGPMAPATANKLVLGARDSGVMANWSRSKLFDVQIYGYALTASEVQGINLITNPVSQAVTGPALGQGLDLDGNFVASEYYGNSAGPILQLGNVYFQASSRAGGTASTANKPNFGTTDDQMNLATLSSQMVSGNLAFSLPSTVAGRPYKLQLVFHDNSSTAVNQRIFSVQAVTGGSTTNFLGTIDCAAFGANNANATNVVIAWQFVGDGNPITLSEVATVSSPILNALTLEDLSGPSNLPNPLPLAAKHLFVGDTLQFIEGATGAQPLSYQWQKLNGSTWVPLVNGGNVSGATTNILTIAGMALSDAGTYQVVVTNSYGSASAEADVTVLQQSPHALIGRWLIGNAEFTDHSGYTPAGTHDGFLIGATNAFAWSSDVPPGFTAGYSADFTASTVSGDVAVAITNSATTDGAYWGTFDRGVNSSFSISVWAKGWPSDYYSFVSKRGEDGRGYSFRSWFGGYPCFTIGAENLFSTTQMDPAQSAWHHFAATRDGVLGIRKLYMDSQLIATQTNDFTPMTNAPTDHLVLGARQQDGYSYWSKVKLYDVQMYGYAISPEEIAGISKITNAPHLLVSPRSQGALVGDTVQLTANADGPYLSYRWQKLNGDTYGDLSDGGNITGSTSNILTLANVTTLNSGSYRLTVTNPAGSTNGIAILTVIDGSARTLIGHWLSGDQTLADGSGFTPAGTHDGAMVGADTTPVWTDDVPASFTGSSLDLSGANAGVMITNTATGDTTYYQTFDSLITNGFSLTVWAKGWPMNWAPFISKGNAAGGTGFLLRSYDSTNMPAFTVGGLNLTGDLVSTIAVDTNNLQWHHYAATRDGVTGIRKLYVDNVLAATLSNDVGPMATDSADHLFLGSGNNSYWSQVKLYDVQIYSYALSAAQIQTINKIQSGTPVPPTFGYSVADGQMTLSWADGVLESTTALLQTNTLWVREATNSPILLNLRGTTGNKFYRVVNP